MEWIEELVQRANELFEEAEEEMETFPGASRAKFKDGIVKLLQAFLTLNEQDCEGDLVQLTEACKQIDPSLESIEGEIMLFQEETDEIDPDVLIDAANEVWDFMIDLLSEDDEQ